ncbi:MAG TPA: hypothetical protein VHO67_09565 [Polyangia bacterium]|nr:hypothetical protein [Polyangia bacterium]
MARPTAVIEGSAPRLLTIAAVAALLASSCGARRAPQGAPAPEPTAPVVRKTTDGTLASENFLAELALARRQHAQRPDDLRRTRALVDHLFMEAQFFGRLADYAEADVVTKAAVRRAPADPEAHLLRARALAAWHEFDEAKAEADRAETLGGEPTAIEQIRVGVWQATGDFDQALPHLRAWRRARPNLNSYGAEAGALADAHEFSKAALAFAEAKRRYDDVSPFAVAWLEFQEGHMWESAGRSDRARTLFESALSRLPRYAPAAGHEARLLAELGAPADLERARALLEPLTVRSDDPEYAGQLGAVYRQMHRDAEGAALIRRAAQGYEALVAQHPAAFYDHAARFFLHMGGDPRRALDYARKNLTIRHTPEARDLVGEAERALVVARLTTPNRRNDP